MCPAGIELIIEWCHFKWSIDKRFLIIDTVRLSGLELYIRWSDIGVKTYYLALILDIGSVLQVRKKVKRSWRTVPPTWRPGSISDQPGRETGLKERSCHGHCALRKQHYLRCTFPAFEQAMTPAPSDLSCDARNLLSRPDHCGRERIHKTNKKSICIRPPAHSHTCDCVQRV
jgi:hypothetical protein